MMSHKKLDFLNPLPPYVSKLSYNFFSFVWKCRTALDQLPPPSLKIGRYL